MGMRNNIDEHHYIRHLPQRNMEEERDSQPAHPGTRLPRLQTGQAGRSGLRGRRCFRPGAARGNDSLLR